MRNPNVRAGPTAPATFVIASVPKSRKAIVTTGGEVTIEGNWKYTGGTGDFQGLTGGGTYKGGMTSPTEVENTWEGVYELAAQARAA